LEDGHIVIATTIKGLAEKNKYIHDAGKAVSWLNVAAIILLFVIFTWAGSLPKAM